MPQTSRLENLKENTQTVLSFVKKKSLALLEHLSSETNENPVEKKNSGDSSEEEKSDDCFFTKSAETDLISTAISSLYDGGKNACKSVYETMKSGGDKENLGENKAKNGVKCIRKLEKVFLTEKEPKSLEQSNINSLYETTIQSILKPTKETTSFVEENVKSGGKNEGVQLCNLTDKKAFSFDPLSNSDYNTNEEKELKNDEKVNEDEEISCESLDIEELLSEKEDNEKEDKAEKVAENIFEKIDKYVDYYSKIDDKKKTDSEKLQPAKSSAERNKNILLEVEMKLEIEEMEERNRMLKKELKSVIQKFRKTQIILESIHRKKIETKKIQKEQPKTKKSAKIIFRGKQSKKSFKKTAQKDSKKDSKKDTKKDSKKETKKEEKTKESNNKKLSKLLENINGEISESSSQSSDGETDAFYDRESSSSLTEEIDNYFDNGFDEKDEKKNSTTNDKKANNKEETDNNDKIPTSNLIEMINNNENPNKTTNLSSIQPLTNPPQKKEFNFGASLMTAATNSTTNKTTNTAKPSSFGIPPSAATNTKTATLIGAQSNTPGSAKSFSFGAPLESNGNQTKETGTEKKTFSFGATLESNGNQTKETGTEKKAFSFGAPLETTENSTAKTGPKSFSFGAPLETTNSSITTSKPSSFGTPNSTSVNSTSGKTSFSFGTPPKSANNPTSNPTNQCSFGTPSKSTENPTETGKKPVSFGAHLGSNTNPSTGIKAPNQYSFGAPLTPAGSSTTGTNTFSFGTPNNPTVTPKTVQSTFGNQQAAETSKSRSFSFGNPIASDAPKAHSFSSNGFGGNVSQKGENASGNPFSLTIPSKAKSFSFGSSIKDKLKEPQTLDEFLDNTANMVQETTPKRFNSSYGSNKARPSFTTNSYMNNANPFLKPTGSAEDNTNPIKFGQKNRSRVDSATELSSRGLSAPPKIDFSYLGSRPKVSGKPEEKKEWSMFEDHGDEYNTTKEKRKNPKYYQYKRQYNKW